jgi:hypothetical protein
MRSGLQPGTLVLSVLQPGGHLSLRYRSHRAGATLSCTGFGSAVRRAGNKNEGGVAMVSGLSRLRLLSVLLPLVLVAPPLGGSLSARPAAPAASSQSSAAPQHLRAMACPRPSTCVAVGDRGTLLRSTDGGRTWRRQTSGTTNDLDGVACLSPSTCVAVGDIMQGTPIRGMMLRTTNGGRTWRSQTSGTTDFLYGVACPSPSTCVAVGNSSIVRSTDGGRTWRSV